MSAAIHVVGPVRLHKRGNVWRAHFNTPEGFKRISLKVRGVKVAIRKAQEIADVLESGDYAAVQVLLESMGSARQKDETGNLILGTSKPTRKTQRTFSEFAQEYLDKHAKPQKTKDSFRRDQSSLKCHLLPAFGDRPLNQITARDVEGYKAMRLSMKRSGKATINRELACLKAIMKKAVEWGEIRVNPTITVPVFKEDPVIPEPLTEAQKENFLQTCRQSANPDLYPIVVCAVETGLRRSKLFHLKWENVDLTDRWIKIRKTKSNQFQVIPISDLLYETLVAQKAKGKGPYVVATNLFKRISA